MRMHQVLADPESKENSYVMKSLVRVLVVSGEDLGPIAEAILKQLVNTLVNIYRSVGNVNFVHWLFEAIAALIGGVCPNNPAAIGAVEVLLFPPFTAILNEDITGMHANIIYLLLSMS